jgi:hypothetical protein
MYFSWAIYNIITFTLSNEDDMKIFALQNHYKNVVFATKYMNLSAENWLMKKSIVVSVKKIWTETKKVWTEIKKFSTCYKYLFGALHSHIDQKLNRLSWNSVLLTTQPV